MPISSHDKEVLWASIPLHGKHGIHGLVRIDLADYEELSQYRWFLGKNGYAYRCFSVKNRTRHVLMHRQVMGLGKGDDRQVDHVNRERLDNRRENLRVVTQLENSRNVAFKGVSLFKQTGKWQAYTRKRDGGRRHLGYFDTEGAAADAVAQAEKEAGRAHLPI